MGENTTGAGGPVALPYAGPPREIYRKIGHAFAVGKAKCADIDANAEQVRRGSKPPSASFGMRSRLPDPRPSSLHVLIAGVICGP